MSQGVPPEWSSSDYEEDADQDFVPAPEFSAEAVARARQALLDSEQSEPVGLEAGE